LAAAFRSCFDVVDPTNVGAVRRVFAEVVPAVVAFATHNRMCCADIFPDKASGGDVVFAALLAMRTIAEVGVNYAHEERVLVCSRATESASTSPTRSSLLAMRMYKGELIPLSACPLDVCHGQMLAPMLVCGAYLSAGQHFIVHIAKSAFFRVLFAAQPRLVPAVLHFDALTVEGPVVFLATHRQLVLAFDGVAAHRTELLELMQMLHVRPRASYLSRASAHRSRPVSRHTSHPSFL
jgi:hypothetical protein